MKKPQKKPAAERQRLERYIDTFPDVPAPLGPITATFAVLLFVGGHESPCLLPAKNLN
jgi:hypothetical protein